jgi:hypothetical protein
MNGAQLYEPHHIDPQLPGTATFGPLQTFGATGLRLALIGMFFAFAGAGIETAFSAAYGTAQFFGWPWGKYRKPAGAPRFTLGWIAMFVASGLIMLAGVDPVALVEYAIVFSVVILPFSYFSVLGPPLTAATWGRSRTARSPACWAGSISRSSRSPASRPFRC